MSLQGYLEVPQQPSDKEGYLGSGRISKLPCVDIKVLLVDVSELLVSETKDYVPPQSSW